MFPSDYCYDNVSVFNPIDEGLGFRAYSGGSVLGKENEGSLGYLQLSKNDSRLYGDGIRVDVFFYVVDYNTENVYFSLEFLSDRNVCNSANPTYGYKIDLDVDGVKLRDIHDTLLEEVEVEFRDGRWNKLTVEWKDGTVKVWVNYEKVMEKDGLSVQSSSKWSIILVEDDVYIDELDVWEVR